MNSHMRLSIRVVPSLCRKPPSILLLAALSCACGPQAFAGSRWMYCRYQTLQGTPVFYYSDVVRVDLKGSDLGYDMATEHIVLRGYRDTVRQRYGLNDGAEPYCYVPLKDGPRDITEKKRSDDIDAVHRTNMKTVNVANWP
jgi:hypothetical protein